MRMGAGPREAPRGPARPREAPAPRGNVGCLQTSPLPWAQPWDRRRSIELRSSALSIARPCARPREAPRGLARGSTRRCSPRGPPKLREAPRGLERETSRGSARLRRISARHLEAPRGLASPVRHFAAPRGLAGPVRLARLCDVPRSSARLRKVSRSFSRLRETPRRCTHLGSAPRGSGRFREARRGTAPRGSATPRDGSPNREGIHKADQGDREAGGGVRARGGRGWNSVRRIGSGWWGQRLLHLAAVRQHKILERGKA